jgi:hypothetical protein
MSGLAILENVRRYRTIASLYRQTAAFRPAERSTLLAQAYEYECRAITELEAHGAGWHAMGEGQEPQASGGAGFQL